MALSLIVFDCDGVILESVDAKTKAFGQVAEPLGAEARDRLLLYHTLHGGVSRREKFAWLYREVFHREITPEEMEDCCARFVSYALDNDGQWMRDWCERVKEDGAVLFSEEGLICNETPDDDVQAACRKLGADLAAW